MNTITWNGDSITVLDQRLLPTKEVYHTYTYFSDIAESIKNMEVRGAPLIGIAAGMGIALSAKNLECENTTEFKKKLNNVLELFSGTRPTAVNLFHVIKRMKKIIDAESDIAKIRSQTEKEAVNIYEEDLKANHAIGKEGSKFIDDGDVVMTYCNAGALATGGYGTAIGVIRSAVEDGKNIEVYACETRPLLQGARLTSWELYKDKIPVTLITDNMAGHFIKSGIIKKIIVGADRVVENGDTANKIGTYSISVLAKEHDVPFYVAAPILTLDPDIKSGDEIKIEERSVDEIAYFNSEQIVPEGISIRNPAFDITPAKNITAIITEKGVIENPKDNGISWVMG